MKLMALFIVMVVSAVLLVGCPSKDNTPKSNAGTLSRPYQSAAIPDAQQRELFMLFTYFYLDPAPDRIDPLIRQVSAHGMWDEPNAVEPMVSFFAHVFAAHPDRIDAWADVVDTLPDPDRIHMCRALHMADTPEASAALVDMMQRAEGEDAAAFQRIVDTAPLRLLDHEPASPAELDMLWSAFFATGERRFIEHICSVFSWDPKQLEQDGDTERTVILGAATWSVTSNIRQHDAVRTICIDLESSTEGQMRTVLKDVLAEAGR